MTVRQAATSLGLSPVTVRKAYREGKLSGRRVMYPGGFSVILVSSGSVEDYRQRHLGRRGPIAARCTECHQPRRRHGGVGHTFRREP